MRPDQCLNIEDLRQVARSRLPGVIFHYLEGGADNEHTLRTNTTDFDRISFLPRYLVDVTTVDTTTSILGQPAKLPVILAPTGMSRLFNPLGELAVARAAARAGLTYSLSTMGSTSIEDIGATISTPKCFQIYPFRDRGLTRAFIQRARENGYTSLCLTVDVPVTGNREREYRNGFMLPPRLGPRVILDGLRHSRWTLAHLFEKPLTLANVIDSKKPMSLTSLAGFIGQQFDPSFTWKQCEWMISEWGGPFAIKGILHPSDALLATKAGATAVIVSTHGGRQLDGAASGIRALPGIVSTIAGKAEIILDGGIRRGTHIVKALALGATACMIGRPYLYGLAAFGECGVDRALEILEAEIRRTMALLGTTNLGAIESSYLLDHGKWASAGN